VILKSPWPDASTGPTAYRYYRLNVTANNGGTNVGITEIELRGTFGGPDLTSPSTTITASADAIGAPEAIDNNTATNNGWLVSSASFPLTLTVDLGAAQLLEQYVVGSYPTTTSTAANSVRDWTLEGSNDNSTWTVLDTQSGQSAWTLGETRVFTLAGVVAPSEPIAYQNYRLLITANNGDANTGILEVEYRETVGGADFTGSGTATASTGSNPARAFDNLLTSGNGWGPAGAAPAPWLRYDLGAGNAKVVRQYLVGSYITTTSTAARSAKDWKLQGSHDGVVWTDLHTVTGQTGWTFGQTRVFTI
jgi:hypothetical protein